MRDCDPRLLRKEGHFIPHYAMTSGLKGGSGFLRVINVTGDVSLVATTGSAK